MAGFVSINRNISPDARKYILSRKKYKPRIIIFIIALILLMQFKLSIVSGFIIFLSVLALLIVKNIENEKNKKYYNLLENGILTKVNLKLISSKNVSRKPGKTNMRYFYEMRYYDLKENVVVTRFTFVYELDLQEYSGIPLAFLASNPKEAVIFHNRFNTSKNKMKGYIKESNLRITNSKVTLQG